MGRVKSGLSFCASKNIFPSFQTFLQTTYSKFAHYRTVWDVDESVFAYIREVPTFLHYKRQEQSMSQVEPLILYEIWNPDRNSDMKFYVQSVLKQMALSWEDLKIISVGAIYVTFLHLETQKEVYKLPKHCVVHVMYESVRYKCKDYSKLINSNFPPNKIEFLGIGWADCKNNWCTLMVRKCCFHPLKAGLSCPNRIYELANKISFSIEFIPTCILNV